MYQNVFTLQFNYELHLKFRFQKIASTKVQY